MADKSRLQERELKKRLDPSKIEIGSDIGPIGNITTSKEPYMPAKKNNEADQRTKE